MSNRIDYFKSERGRIFIPGHKQWVQLFKRCEENDVKKLQEVDGESVEVIVNYAYFMRQIEYSVEFETTEDIEGEEVEVSVERYLEENFDKVWWM